MPSDTEPRYRLVDSNGNVVGSLYAEADGTLKLQEGTSGSDNEVSIATDGTFSAPAVSTDYQTTGTYGARETETASVDTTETVVFEGDPEGTGVRFSSSYTAKVSNNTTTIEKFEDIVHVGYDFTNVISGYSRSGAPTRSYSAPMSENIALSLTLGSGSYDITVEGSGLIDPESD